MLLNQRLCLINVKTLLVLVLVIESYILSAAIKMLGTTLLTDTPPETMVITSNIWTYDQEKRKRVLMQLAGTIVDRFIKFEFNSSKQFTSCNDKIYCHSIQLLRFGMYYLNY